MNICSKLKSIHTVLVLARERNCPSVLLYCMLKELWRNKTSIVCHLSREPTTKCCALLHKSKNVWNGVAMTRWALRSFVLSLFTVLYLHATVYSKWGFFFACTGTWINWHRLNDTDWLINVLNLVLAGDVEVLVESRTQGSKQCRRRSKLSEGTLAESGEALNRLNFCT